MDDHDEEIHENMDEFWYEEGADAAIDYWNHVGKPLAEEWREEIHRRKLEENLPDEEVHILRRTREEKELGVLWYCGLCGIGHRVKTPFTNLYCPRCLGQLTAIKYMPYKNTNTGYWMLDDG